MTKSLQKQDPLSLRTAEISGFEYDWWAGNVRLTDLSGKLLGAHLCHAALMSFVPGALVIQEAAYFQSGVPVSEQSLAFIPHLATLGIGVGAGGAVLDTSPFVLVGVFHFFIAVICLAGGLFHTYSGEADLGEAPEGSVASRVNYDWEDFESTSYIMGFHILCLSIACFLFAGNAAFGNGLYDPLVGEVRQISPNLNPITLVGYIFGFANGGWTPIGMAAVNNMEDLVGGHFLVATLTAIGGVFHILYRKPTPFFLRRPVFSVVNGGWVRQGFCNSEAILSFSVAGVGFIAVSSSIFVRYCDLAFPAEFYALDRSGSAAIQLALGLIWMLGGGLWHNVRGEKLYALRGK
ncbi:high light inducible protein [Acaryochloris marina NIES-2412]|uniref:high light inducible protein n=1 Tax=Acaryochloris marina TaxID=155978 RepID=UPI004059EF89